MTQLILHIPHSSERIPSEKGYIVGREVLDQEILKLTDWYTDDLFSFDDAITVRADFSRVFCDVERFSDDSKEVMAKYGMGVLYEKADDGTIIREVDKQLREEILNNYYRPHHERLTRAVNSQLELNGKALIVDCHSFPTRPFIRDLDQTPDRPDFNIGTDSFHTPQYLVDFSKNFFNERGYTLGLDWPYSGSVVPLTHYNQSKNVSSIMLEINRSLYMDEPLLRKSDSYLKVKKTVLQYLKMVSEAFETNNPSIS